MNRKKLFSLIVLLFICQQALPFAPWQRLKNFFTPGYAVKAQNTESFNEPIRMAWHQRVNDELQSCIKLNPSFHMKTEYDKKNLFNVLQLKAFFATLCSKPLAEKTGPFSNEAKTDVTKAFMAMHALTEAKRFYYNGKLQQVTPFDIALDREEETCSNSKLTKECFHARQTLNEVVTALIIAGQADQLEKNQRLRKIVEQREKEAETSSQKTK